MPEPIDSTTLQRSIKSILDRVVAGESFAILRRGKTLALLVPPTEEMSDPAPVTSEATSPIPMPARDTLARAQKAQKAIDRILGGVNRKSRF